MTTALAIVVAILLVAVLLLYGAVLEFYRQLHQVRQHLGFMGEPREVEHNAEIERSSLPGFREDRHKAQDRSAVLLLSESCSTCHDLSTALGDLLVPQLTVVMASRSEESGREWTKRHGLQSRESVKFDTGETAEILDVNVVPSVVLFEGMQSISAQTVSSQRELSDITKWLTKEPAQTMATA